MLLKVLPLKVKFGSIRLLLFLTFRRHLFLGVQNIKQGSTDDYDLLVRVNGLNIYLKAAPSLNSQLSMEYLENLDKLYSFRIRGK